jgi:hypothetical protein
MCDWYQLLRVIFLLLELFSEHSHRGLLHHLTPYSRIGSGEDDEGQYKRLRVGYS